MLPQTQPRRRRNSATLNLLISLGVHAAVIIALAYFAAREGLLGKQLKKIAVEMVKEKPPEKPKEPEKPKPPEPPKAEPPKPTPAPVAPPPKVAMTAPKVAPPAPARVAPPPVAAPPAVAPPAMEVPAFVFEGGKAVESTADPVQLYKGYVEYALRSKWNRPVDLADHDFVAEIEVSVDREGRISQPDWRKGSGNSRWDASVRGALAATQSLNRPPPANFPPRIVIRFDVQEVADNVQP
jgi:outer membrane biosynthesis protein TonB